jgi:NAD(P)-dependent dehydrogenase (short-subunit alcohol dehydrogenase family)
MVHQIEQQLGSIDILVNNAGMAAVRSLDDITEEDFDRAIAVNLKSVFLCPRPMCSLSRLCRSPRVPGVWSPIRNLQPYFADSRATTTKFAVARYPFADGGEPSALAG